MAETTIDYQEVFRAVPGPMALLTLDGVILDVNDDFLETSGRSREQVLGRNLFEAFPVNPYDPGVRSQDQLRDSFDAVVATGERDHMLPLRYDVEDPGRPGSFEERYWVVVNTPMHDPAGRVVMITHKAEEVTHIVNKLRSRLADQG